MSNSPALPSPTTAQDWHELFAKSGESYFFGREPSELARLAVGFWKERNSERRVPLLDLGCGEGRDAVYYAREGFAVTAVDGAPSALVKVQRLAHEANVTFPCTLADIREYPLPVSLPFLSANNCLQFLGESCISHLEDWKTRTPVGGFHAISVFTTTCVLAREGIYRFEPNQLKDAYSDWNVLYYGEEMIWREPSQKHLSFARVIATRV